MSAGASPTGGVGGIFYAVLFIVGIIYKKDQEVLMAKSTKIMPITLVIVFVLIITINYFVISRYMEISEYFSSLSPIQVVISQPEG